MLPSFPGEKDQYVEGNVREKSLRDIWMAPGAFAYNRDFEVTQLQGFCRTCRFADICRGGCTWTAYSRSGSRYDNTLCFVRSSRAWYLSANTAPCLPCALFSRLAKETQFLRLDIAER